LNKFIILITIYLIRFIWDLTTIILIVTFNIKNGLILVAIDILSVYAKLVQSLRRVSLSLMCVGLIVKVKFIYLKQI